MEDTLTPQLIDAYQTILKSPAEYGLKMKPFQEYFKESKSFNPQHVLAEEFFGSAYSIGASAGYYIEFVND